MNAAELNKQVIDAVHKLRQSLEELEHQAVQYAKAERAYRLAKSTAYLTTQGTVGEREAKAEAAINELRFQRDLSDGLKSSALEAVRSNRTIVSAIQTLARLYTEEASFDRTGPQEVA